jgi:hypothetical protein
MLESIKRAKLSTNATSAIVIVAGLVYLGFTFNRDPNAAAAQALPVLGAMAGVVKLLRQGDIVEAKADAATEQSQHNGAQIRQVAAQVDPLAKKVDGIGAQVEDNTALTLETKQTGEKTHVAVNSRMDELIAKVEEQGRTLATLAGERGRAEGIEEGRQQERDARSDRPTEQAP